MRTTRWPSSSTGPLYLHTSGDSTDMHSPAGYSPYEGWSIQGKVTATILRGEVIMQDGKLLKSPGYGKYLPREAKK